MPDGNRPACFFKEDFYMTKKDFLEISKDKLSIFCGILFHNQQFAPGRDVPVEYDLSCPEYVELKEKYELEKISGKGSDFSRAKRLLHFLSPRLSHASWYDNHVPCNALDLMDYSFDDPQHGINCLNKSKILAECCLALGIYARRVIIMPYSPYDFDNHVVTEVYDRRLEKWIMLDPTTDGYFIDENKMPLSVLEIRHRFANDEFVTFVSSTDRLMDIERSCEKNAGTNAYICKNLFYFYVERQNRFGLGDRWLTFSPLHFSGRQCDVQNVQYRLNHLPEQHHAFRKGYEDRLKRLKSSDEYELIDIAVMRQAPKIK